MCGADEGSQTLLSSLGSWCSTDELRLHLFIYVCMYVFIYVCMYHILVSFPIGLLKTLRSLEVRR